LKVGLSLRRAKSQTSIEPRCLTKQPEVMAIAADVAVVPVVGVVAVAVADAVVAGTAATAVAMVAMVVVAVAIRFRKTSEKGLNSWSQPFSAFKD